MIDIEIELFNLLATALRAKYSPIAIYGEQVKTPATFPCVIIEEKDNSMYAQTQDSGDLENHVQVMYEIGVYSNKQTGKKSQCKEIMATIDAEMKELGFTRISINPVPNLESATIYRLIARYRAVVSKDKTIFRR